MAYTVNSIHWWCPIHWMGSFAVLYDDLGTNFST